MVVITPTPTKMSGTPTGRIIVAGILTGGTSVKNGFADSIIDVPTVGRTTTRPSSAQKGRERRITIKKIIALHCLGIHHMKRNTKI